MDDKTSKSQLNITYYQGMNDIVVSEQVRADGCVPMHARTTHPHSRTTHRLHAKITSPWSSLSNELCNGFTRDERNELKKEIHRMQLELQQSKCTENSE